MIKYLFQIYYYGIPNALSTLSLLEKMERYEECADVRDALIFVNS